MGCPLGEGLGRPRRLPSAPHKCLRRTGGAVARAAPCCIANKIHARCSVCMCGVERKRSQVTRAGALLRNVENQNKLTKKQEAVRACTQMCVCTCLREIACMCGTTKPVVACGF